MIMGLRNINTCIELDAKPIHKAAQTFGPADELSDGMALITMQISCLYRSYPGLMIHALNDLYVDTHHSDRPRFSEEFMRLNVTQNQDIATANRDIHNLLYQYPEFHSDLYGFMSYEINPLLAKHPSP